MSFIWYGALEIEWIHTNINTYLHTVFSLTCTEDVVWTEGIHPISLPQSSSVIVWIIFFKCAVPRVVSPKNIFWLFFGLICTQEGVSPYKHS